MINRFVHMVGLCTLALAAVVLILSKVSPPPKSAPTYNSVSINQTAPDSSKAALALLVSASSWEVKDYGPFTYAKGTVLGKPTMEFVGIAGKWYSPTL